MKLDQLLKSAEAFEKLAAFDFAAICKNLGTAIQAEVAGGIQAINRLVTTDKEAANSQGIQSLDDIFAKIGDSARGLEPRGASISIRDMKAQIGNGTFYTSSFNAGTGYDPNTRKGGAYSPAAYLNRINAYVRKLEKYLAYYESQQSKEVNPGQHNPSLPSV